MIQYFRDVDVESRGRGEPDTPHARGIVAARNSAQQSASLAYSANVHLPAAKLPALRTTCQGGDVMERRHFLKLTFGFVAGAAALAASAKAAPLPPVSPHQDLVPPHGEAAEPAVVSQDEVDHLAPEEVRWGRRWHGRGHWGRRRHWGWRRRRHWGWRRRHWGWHRRHRRHWGWRRHWRRHRW